MDRRDVDQAMLTIDFVAIMGQKVERGGPLNMSISPLTQILKIQ